MMELIPAGRSKALARSWAVPPATAVATRPRASAADRDRQGPAGTWVHSFSRIRIQAQLSEPAGPESLGSAEGLGPAESMQTGEPSSAEGAEGLDEPTGRAACPVTAVFLSMLAGPEKSGCQVESGKQGVAREAQFRLAGVPTNQSATVDEQFKALEDPYGAIGLLKPVGAQTLNGIFNDCYKLESKDPLPVDFRLKVEQNHLYNKQIISKNHITFTPGNIRFCHFERLPDKCDFGNRCKT